MKKLITMCMVLALALALAVPCFASTVYPSLPLTDKSEWVIFDNGDGRIGAINSNSITCSDTGVTTGIYTMYMLENGQWSQYSSDWVGSFEGMGADHVLYDSTGYFANKISFALNSSSFTDVLEEMGEQISVSTVVEVLIWVAVGVVGLAFMWWGVRKLTRALMTAFRKGKITV